MKSKKKLEEFRNVEESLERVLEIYRYLITLFQKALDVTDEEGDDEPMISLLVLRLTLKKQSGCLQQN